MTKDDLLALAERCEASSGPDRELDGAIQRALGPDHPAHFSSVGVCDAFIASLDAAMMLVPGGQGVQISLLFGLDGEESAIVSPLKRIGLPRTFAAVALRARASLTEQSHE